MRGLRAVLVTVPPLLADIARRVLISRAELSIIAEIADSEIADLETAAKRLRDLTPDVVIIGYANTPRTLNATLVRLMLPRARVLAVSTDLTQVFGPGEDDVNEFTPETLANCLRR